jgi:hypothetical protein
MWHLKIIVLLLATLISGCATLGPRFEVSVDSLTSPGAQKKRTYLLLPGNKDVTWDDLQFQEYSVYVMRALALQGFVTAQNVEDVDVAIVVTYGIGNPHTIQNSYSAPVWGQTGVSSANSYGTATKYGNTASYSGTTTFTPTYGITGYTSHVTTQTTYFRYAVMTGYDFKTLNETEKEIQLWRTTVTSAGSSGDLRKVFPVLISASVPHIATNTKNQILVQLHENDKIVRTLKGEHQEK